MAGGAIVGTADTSRIEAPVTFKAYLICAFASFGGIFFGYDTGWMGGVLGMPYFKTQYTGIQYDYATGKPINATADEFALPSSRQSLMTSILSAGTFLGALLAGDAADFLGRRPTIIIGCFIFAIGTVLEMASAGQLGLFCAGRFFAGVGVGFESSVIILYMSEIAPKKVRGALVAGYQFCITIGILLANCVVYATQNRPDTGSYRIPIAIQYLWAIILASGLFLLPESPRYYVKKGDIARATASLCSVRGQPEDSEYIRDELAEIIANYEYEQKVSPQGGYLASWTVCFSGSLSKPSSNLRRTLCGVGLQAMQQLTGVNFIFYFGTVFFQGLGSIKNPFLISLITTLVNVCSTPISFWTVERFGRRAILIYGGIGMVVAQYIVAIMGTTLGDKFVADPAGGPDVPKSPATVSAMIAFICINIFFFATTWGPAAWIVIGEIFPLPIRSRGIALSTASNWAWNCCIASINPFLVGKDKANLKSKVFFLWGSLCALSVLYAYFLVPETKGLSLEQVDRMLEETNPRNSAAWVPHSTFAAELGMVKGSEKVVDEEHSQNEKA